MTGHKQAIHSTDANLPPRAQTPYMLVTSIMHTGHRSGQIAGFWGFLLEGKLGDWDSDCDFPTDVPLYKRPMKTGLQPPHQQRATRNSLSRNGAPLGHVEGELLTLPTRFLLMTETSMCLQVRGALLSFPMRERENSRF